MTFILVASILLFLPGYMLSYILNLNDFRYLLSFSLSYALFVLLLQLSPHFGLSVSVFEYTYFSLIGILMLVAGVKYYRERSGNSDTGTIKCHNCDGYLRYIPLYILIFVVGYFLKVGAYIEVPSDVLQHMEYIQQMTRIIDYADSRNEPIVSYLGQNGKLWHYFYSFVSRWSGVSLHEAILPASVFNVSVFLVGVFFFSQVVFKQEISSRKVLLWLSIAAVFFTFFHFGINIFAFIRYYAIAPVMLNLVLYFTVMAVVIDFYRDDIWKFRYLIVAAIVFIVSLHIHRQEAVFALLMVSIMSFYLFFQKHAVNIKLIWQGEAGVIQFRPVRFLLDKVNLSFLLSNGMMFSLFIYSYIFISRHPINSPKVIGIENLLPFFKNLYILNPTYQFYYVVTLWGAMVILLFSLNFRKLANNPYIMAGMLSPFFTVFNPVFTDLFLRHTWSLMLWRMSFLVPLQLVGAYFFVMAVQYVRQGAALKRVTGTLVIVALIFLLYPFKTTFVENTYTRIPTLKPVKVKNSPEHWGDLLDYLRSIEDEKRIITDPITGYMLTALTQHKSTRAKFHRQWGGFIRFNLKDYSDHPFDRYRGSLFIINKRNGAMSKVGRIAKHWPEGILQVEKYYYASNLEPYIMSNPDRFKLLWEKNKIRVYEIDRPGKK